LRHIVARRLADVDPERCLTREWAHARNHDSLIQARKGRLMKSDYFRSGAAALALSFALGAGAAMAQQTAPAKPAAPAPAPAPAAPAPGAQTQPAPPPIPSKVDLVSPESQWSKLCSKEPNSGRDVCFTIRDFSPSADQPPMIMVNLSEMQGEEKRKLRLMIAPIGMLIKPGFRVIIDNGEPIKGEYLQCAPNACASEIDLAPNALAALKKGQTMSVVMRVPTPNEPSGHELTFNLSLKDLGPTFDGKPTDPKLIEQQRQQLQQQLQKKAEEQRRQLEQQNGAAAPAAPVAPVAPVAPAAPTAPAAPAK
jgi:invasion protein IalB